MNFDKKKEVYFSIFYGKVETRYNILDTFPSYLKKLHSLH